MERTDDVIGSRHEHAFTFAWITVEPRNFAQTINAHYNVEYNAAYFLRKETQNLNILAPLYFVSDYHLINIVSKILTPFMKYGIIVNLLIDFTVPIFL